MSLQDPQISESLEKLSEKFPEGTPFFLEEIRTVEANTIAYGKGEMVVVRVRGNEKELGIWGAYLLQQAKSVVSSDLNQWYIIERKQIPGFGKGGRPVKAFVPAAAPAPAAA